MNMLEKLASQLRDTYPSAAIKIDVPKRSEGNWWLDFCFGPNSAEIEWRPGHGFGVSVNSPPKFGDRSDEVYATVEKVFARVKELIDRGANTEAPPEFFSR